MLDENKSSMQILKNHNLKPYTTFGIDAYTALFVEVTSIAELKQALALSCDNRLILGGGSNLLFCEDFDGLVIRIRMTGIEVTELDGNICLHVAAGENWHSLVEWTLNKGFYGLENLALIPGVVGAAPVQNIGAYGVEMKDVCHYVDVLDTQSLEIERLSADVCRFGYRDSIFKREKKDTAIIVAVGLTLTTDARPKVNYGALAKLGTDSSPQRVFEQVCATRMAKLPDPKVLGNVGSFFKNPVIDRDRFEILTKQHADMPNYAAGDQVKLAAGWLIDQCHLKGKQIGGAQVHTEQALVIVNLGDASARDVIALAAFVRETVLARFAIDLQHEVRFIGKEGETTLSDVVDG